MDKTLAEQIAAVKREIAFREQLYPRWVAKGTMTLAKGEHELECMRAVLATLQAVAEEHHG